MSSLFEQKEMILYCKHATGRFGGMNLDHRTGLVGESEKDEGHHVSGVLLGRPEEEGDVKSLFLHGKKYFQYTTGHFGGLNLDHRTGLAPEEADNAKSPLVLQKDKKLYFQYATGHFGGLNLDHRTGLAPEEADNAKSPLVFQKDKKLYFQHAAGHFGGLNLDHRNGLEGQSQQVVEEGGDETEDEGEDSNGSGFNGGGADGGDSSSEDSNGSDFNGGGADGGDSSSDGGLVSLPIIQVKSPELRNRIGFVRDFFSCGSVHALEHRVKAVLRRELGKDTYRISYFIHGPNNSQLEIDISQMSWDAVLEAELQGAFVYDDLDPGHDAGASCSRPKRKHRQPSYLKDFYTF